MFLDTNSNPNTGLPHGNIQSLFGSFFGINDSLKYSTSDISPEYVIVIGVEGDGIWKWDLNSSDWVSFDTPEFVTMINDTNYFEIGINLNNL